MRIISGKYGRRRFDVPTHIKARPTTDFARENLFNVLQNLLDFEGMKALDAAESLQSKIIRYNTILSAKWPPNSTPVKSYPSREMYFVSSRHVGKSSISSLPTRLTIYPNSTKSRPSYSMPGYWLREGFSSSNIQKNMISPICPSSTNKEYTAVSISVFSLPTKI